MQIINCTPHTINLLNKDLYKLGTYPPSGIIPRVKQTITPLPESTDKLPLAKSDYGEIQDLPEKKQGTIYIVSALVVAALKKERLDLFFPAQFERDTQGNILGCKCFSR